MTTLNYNTIDYNIVYIDPTLATPGDGTTPALALSTFPTPLVDNTCYIIRRTSEESLSDLPQTKRTTNMTRILLLGMPFEDSAFYPLIPDEVKTAWGGDIAKYANIRMNVASYTTNASNSVVFDSGVMQTFICENCYFFRDGNGGSANDNLSPMFWFDTTAPDIIFNSCKFGYAQYDIDNDDFLNNNTDVTTDKSKYPQFKCGTYIYADIAATFTLNNCIINWVVRNFNPTDNNYKMHNSVMQVYTYCRQFLMSGCTFNILNREDNLCNNEHYDFAGIGILRNGYSTTDNYNKVIIRDTTINHIFCSGNKSLSSLRAIQIGGIRQELENITINFKGMKDFTVDGLDFTNTTHVINCDMAKIYTRANNINCDMTKEGSLSISGAPLLRLMSNYRSIGNPNNYIKNINFKFPDDPERVIPTELNVLQLDGNNYNYVSDDGWTYSNETEYSSTGRTFLADNIIVEAYKQTGNALYCKYSNARSDHIYGSVYLTNSTLDVNIIKTYYTEKASQSLKLDHASYLKCNEFIGNEDRYTGHIQLTTNTISSAYIGKSNLKLFNEIAYTDNTENRSNSILVCPNYIVNGQFFARNSHTFAKSWTTTRTGSNSAACLKFNNNTVSSSPNTLRIGLEPYSGIELVPTTTGKHKLTCYLAAKNFTETELPNGSKLCWLDVVVPETLENNLETTHVYTSKAMPWYKDDSTWSGDSGLNTYKIEMIIDIKEITNPIDVKINYCWYGVDGFVYLDPDIRLTPMS